MQAEVSLMQQKIFGSVVDIIPEATHAAHLENTAYFLQEVVKFLG